MTGTGTGTGKEEDKILPPPPSLDAARGPPAEPPDGGGGDLDLVEEMPSFPRRAPANGAGPPAEAPVSEQPWAQVIAAFDAEQEAAWGAQRRQLPHNGDRGHAERWLETELTVEEARNVFAKVFGKMIFNDPDARPPSSLKYCDEPVKRFLATKPKPGVYDGHQVPEPLSAEVQAEVDEMRRKVLEG